jgi:hypothetical protein
VAVATLRSGSQIAIADANASVVRVVPARTDVFFGRSMRAGFIYAVAGTGATEQSKDGGPGSSAALDRPDSVAYDPKGKLLIGDWFNQRVRVVACTTGIFYGKKMAAGHTFGQTGDGGPATAAEIESLFCYTESRRLANWRVDHPLCPDLTYLQFA